jgi:hypothetical protein
MTRELGPPDETFLMSDPETLAVRVDVTGLPAVMALARAARDVIDHAEDGPNHPASGMTWPVVRPADLRALEAAVEPIYPGPAT